MSHSNGVHQRSAHPIYQELHESEDFADVKRRYRSFVVPATVVFLGWYLLYVIMSNWAHDFMSTKVVGNINVALVFGLLQFLTTFLLAWVYSRYSNSRLDPLAAQLADHYYDGRER